MTEQYDDRKSHNCPFNVVQFKISRDVCYIIMCYILNKHPRKPHIMNTYQDNTHYKNDHANYSSEGNKVVREWKRKLWLEDHVGSACQEKR